MQFYTPCCPFKSSAQVQCLDCLVTHGERQAPNKNHRAEKGAAQASMEVDAEEKYPLYLRAEILTQVFCIAGKCPGPWQSWVKQDVRTAPHPHLHPNPSPHLSFMQDQSENISWRRHCRWDRSGAALRHDSVDVYVNAHQQKLRIRGHYWQKLRLQQVMQEVIWGIQWHLNTGCRYQMAVGARILLQTEREIAIRSVWHVLLLTTCKTSAHNY